MAKMWTALLTSEAVWIHTAHTKYRPIPRARARQSKKKLVPPRKPPYQTPLTMHARKARPESASARGKQIVLVREQASAATWLTTRTMIARSMKRKLPRALAYTNDAVVVFPPRLNSGRRMTENNMQKINPRQQLTAHCRGSRSEE